MPLPFDFEIFLAGIVKEQLVIESLRRRASKRAANLGRERDAVDQVLARHLVIDAGATQRMAQSAFHWHFTWPTVTGSSTFFGIGIVVKVTVPFFRVALLDRHLQHLAAGGRDGQEWRIGGAPSARASAG